MTVLGLFGTVLVPLRLLRGSIHPTFQGVMTLDFGLENSLQILNMDVGLYLIINFNKKSKLTLLHACKLKII